MHLKSGWLITGICIGWLGGGGLVAPASAQTSEQQAWVEVIKSAEKDIAAEKTLVLANTFAKEFPRSSYQPVADYIQAEYFFQNQNYTQALVLYQSLSQPEKKLPFWDSILFRWGECWFNLGEWDKAEEIWQGMKRLAPAGVFLAELEANHCQLLLAKGNFKEAAQRYRSLQTDFPFFSQNPKVLTGLARMDFTNHDYSLVLDRLKTCQTAEAWYLKGKSLIAIQQFGEIAKKMEQPAAVPPALKPLGPVYLDWLLELYREKKYALLLTILDKLLLEQGFEEKTILDFILLKACCLLQGNQLQPAALALNHWLAESPADPGRQYAQFLLGVIDYQRRDIKAARERWKNLLADSQNVALGGKAMLLAAAEYLQAGDDQNTAKDIYLLLIQRYPEDPDSARMFNNLAVAYYKLGQDQKAMLAYKEYIRRLPAGRNPQSTKSLVTLSTLLEYETCPLLQTLRERLGPELVPYEKALCRSQTSFAASPWLTLIIQPPILVVNVQPPGFSIMAWEFQVTGAGGTLLFSQTGNATLPEKMIWDGRLPDNRFVLAGETIQYKITLKPDSGKPLTTLSNPIKIHALSYTQGGTRIIDLWLPLLFDKKSVGELSVIGASVLNQSCDLMFPHLRQSIEVEVHASNAEQSQVRTERIVQYLQERLGVPPGFVRVRPVSSTNPSEEWVRIYLPE